MKRIVFFLLIMMLLGIFLGAEKLAEFNYVCKYSPSLFLYDDFYTLADLSDGMIRIMDARNHQERLHFGKKGEGPGEFINFLTSVSVTKEYILAGSMGRLSFFDHSGAPVRDIKLEMNQFVIGPVGGNLALRDFQIMGEHRDKGKEIYRLDTMDMKEIRVLYEKERVLDMFHQRLVPLFVTWSCDGTHLALADPAVEGGNITLYDEKGEVIGRVNHPFEIFSLSAEAKDKLKKDFQKSMNERQWPKEFKERMKAVIPDSYPPFSHVMLDGERLLVYTHEESADRVHALCFSLRGEYLGKISQPKGETGMIYKGNSYRIVENEEDETWELHRWPVPKAQKEH